MTKHFSQTCIIMLIFLIEMSKRRAFCLRARSETDSEIKCCHGNRHFPLSMSFFFFCVRQTLNIWTKSHHFSFLTKTLTERDSFRYHCMFRASLWQLQSGFFTDVKSLNGLFAIQHKKISFFLYSLIMKNVQSAYSLPFR